MSPSSPVQPALFRGLPDHASQEDERALAIDKVGIKDLSYPIQVLDKHNQVQHTVARVNLYVGLPQQFKGTHMSRFVEVLNARRGEMTIRNLPEILSDIQRRLGAEDAHLELSFPYFIAKRAPISGVESLMAYQCAFRASKRNEQVEFVLAVQVPVKSLCPCSKAISEYGAHNQRSYIDVQIRSEQFLWIEDIVQAVEACGSAPLFALLKREDEKYITELAYQQPKFVEDLVRDVVLALRAFPGVQWLRVAAENQESIHNHSAYGEITWTPASDATQEQASLPFPAKAPEPTFGTWLKELRMARAMSQQELADALQISAAHLSRVESDGKRLSEEALARLAEVLGQDPEETAVRAGVLTLALQQRIAAHPQAFLAWAARQASR
jgi:GTP cyclohydrolase I